MKRDRSPMKYLILITQVGLSMITPILIGVFVGQWLDKIFSAGGVFFIIFMLLGVWAAFYNLFKVSRLMGKKDKRREHRDEE